MQLETLRKFAAGSSFYAESYRRMFNRMSNETVTDRRVYLVKEILQNGEGLERIESEPEAPPPNGRVQAAMSKSIEWLIDEDIPNQEKALRIGAIVRLPWMDAESLREIRDDVPPQVWAEAARIHEFGETRQERERFLEVLNDSAAMELKMLGVPSNAIEAWNLHFMARGDVHLLHDIGHDGQWPHLDRLVPLYEAGRSPDVAAWLQDNGGQAGKILVHLMETDQAMITHPSTLESMLKHCRDDDALYDAIERFDAVDGTVIPMCVRRWHDDVAHRRSLGSRIDERLAENP